MIFEVIVVFPVVGVILVLSFLFLFFFFLEVVEEVLPLEPMLEDLLLLVDVEEMEVEYQEVLQLKVIQKYLVE
jgi:hypothetical protein